jgi:hypothetical protein
LIIFTFFSISSFAQKEIKLKRKYFGNYKGQISSYKLDTSNEILDVGSTPIYIQINSNDVILTVGTRELRGFYEVMFEAKKYYLLEAELRGQVAPERIMVYKRGKHIARDGMYPQPVTELKKFK